MEFAIDEAIDRVVTREPRPLATPHDLETVFWKAASWKVKQRNQRGALVRAGYVRIPAEAIALANDARDPEQLVIELFGGRPCD